MNTQNSSKVIRVLIILLALALIFIVPEIEHSVNKTIKTVLYEAGSAAVPDSNIVLIHISENDIKKLGSWPLKRSYYALLIQKLDELKVKKIGIEVFLSPRQSFQSLYNNLLSDQISKSGNVVLASIVSGLDDNGQVFRCDNVLYPEPYNFDREIKTGHLNYLEENGIIIPNYVKMNSGYEPSFSSAISGIDKPEKETRLRFISEWKDYTNYELVEFFSLFQKKDSELKNLQDKIVLIGVSAGSDAKFTDSPFDDRIPGIALHAMAIDNILNNRSLSIQYSYYFSAAFLIFLFGAQLQVNVRKRFNIHLGYVLVFIATGWALFAFAGEELNYSFIIVPLICVAVFDIYNFISEKQRSIKNQLDESENTKISLNEKEAHLAELQRELNLNPDDPPQKLINEINLLKQELGKLRSKFDDENVADNANVSYSTKEFHGIIYRSKKIEQAVDLVKRVAPEEATVLITGESGSGKELIARAVHNLSKRKENSFIAVNCAALSETLLESELFGHVKGAFTNAVSDKQGRFEAADKGTIFLDEIGEISENFQAKLLRILQSGEFEKVGSSNTIKIDARVVAATNKNLEEQVSNKKFREDLYYRLKVIKIELPPLRERREDIAVIANHFVQRENSGISLSKAVLETLEENDWKGNVRELESVIKHALIFAKSDKREIIKLCDLPGDLSNSAKHNIDEQIIESLRDKNFSHSSINETAKELGNLNRTVVSENLRGMFFKSYVNSNFNFMSGIKEIAQTENEETIEKVSSKCELYLNNIKKDIAELTNRDFESAKKQITSKYKNLPQKYHVYLDSILNHLLNK